MVAFSEKKVNAALAWQSPKALCFAKSAGVLACETLGVGNFFGYFGYAALARQPPKALCFAKSAGDLACETLGDGNFLDTLGTQR